MSSLPPSPSDAVETLEDARGIPQVGRRRRGNRWLTLLIAMVTLVLCIALGAKLLMDKLGSTARGKQTTEKAELGHSLPDMTQGAFNRNNPPPPPPPGATVAAGGATPLAGPESVELTATQRAALALAQRRRHSELFAEGAEGGAAAPGEAPADHRGLGAEPANDTRSSLGDAMSATRLQGAVAGRLADPNLMITQGQFLDCTLVTAINSSLPGMTRCVLSHDIYSTNGRVLLLERGSRLIGQYQSAQLRQGMRRIFVLWTRAETPEGVLVHLDSPSTDPVGRTGVDGQIDNHFLQRFGAALLVSIVDDISTYEQAKVAASRNGATPVLSLNSTAGSGDNLASIIVQNTINIPPTLDKAQGGHIGIFVARDVNFGNVYALRATY